MGSSPPNLPYLFDFVDDDDENDGVHPECRKLGAELGAFGDGNPHRQRARYAAGDHVFACKVSS